LQPGESSRFKNEYNNFFCASLWNSASAVFALLAGDRERALLDESALRTAIDSTGLESSAASGYFVRRRERVGMPWKKVVYHHFPKLGVVCDARDAFHSRRAGGSRTEARRGPTSGRSCPRRWRGLKIGPHCRRRRLRLGAQPPLRSQGVSGPLDHPPKHGQPNTKPAKVTTDAYAIALRYHRLSRSHSSGDRDLDGQAASRSLRLWTHRLESTPRIAIEGPRPRRHDSVTHQGFLQSRPAPFSSSKITKLLCVEGPHEDFIDGDTLKPPHGMIGRKPLWTVCVRGPCLIAGTRVKLFTQDVGARMVERTARNRSIHRTISYRDPATFALARCGHI